MNIAHQVISQEAWKEIMVSRQGKSSRNLNNPKERFTRQAGAQCRE